MTTECILQQIHFQGLKPHCVVGDFSAGHVSLDAGILLLREIDTIRGLLKNFSN